jgi:nucleoside-diphosphate-sugar epimerase
VTGEGESQMKPSLFITGVGGFVGKQLLAKLDPSSYQTVYCLARRRETVRLPDQAAGKIRVVEGDILNSGTYEKILENVHTVIHLAAVTGKVKPKEYFRINAYGTLLLLDRCKKAGVKRFLFVSSIAVSFQNKHRYFYAQSKEQAEAYVKASGLAYTILRPTMIMGKSSAVFAGLARLASLPLIPVFGRGELPVQPIYVGDVASALLAVEANPGFNGQVLELGGPEPLPINALLEKIARRQGKENPKTLHLPMGLTVFALSLLERVVYGLLPLTVGQLASFRNNGTAGENALTQTFSGRMTGLDEMIADSLEGGADDGLARVEIPANLARECRTFCRYLVKQNPNAYVLEKYLLCHQKIPLTPVDFHDALLLKLAARSPFFTRMTDAYSRFFRPASTLRKKLAYLVAILEVSPPFFRYYDRADGMGKLVFLLRAGLKGAGLALHLLVSLFFLLPLQVLAKLLPKKPAAVLEKN